MAGVTDDWNTKEGVQDLGSLTVVSVASGDVHVADTKANGSLMQDLEDDGVSAFTTVPLTTHKDDGSDKLPSKVNEKEECVIKEEPGRGSQSVDLLSGKSSYDHHEVIIDISDRDMSSAPVCPQEERMASDYTKLMDSLSHTTSHNIDDDGEEYDISSLSKEELNSYNTESIEEVTDEEKRSIYTDIAEYLTEVVNKVIPENDSDVRQRAENMLTHTTYDDTDVIRERQGDVATLTDLPVCLIIDSFNDKGEDANDLHPEIKRNAEEQHKYEELLTGEDFSGHEDTAAQLEDIPLKRNDSANVAASSKAPEESDVGKANVKKDKPSTTKKHKFLSRLLLGLAYTSGDKKDKKGAKKVGKESGSTLSHADDGSVSEESSELKKKKLLKKFHIGKSKDAVLSGQLSVSAGAAAGADASEATDASSVASSRSSKATLAAQHRKCATTPVCVTNSRLRLLNLGAKANSVKETAAVAATSVVSDAARQSTTVNWLELLDGRLYPSRQSLASDAETPASEK